MRQAWLALDIGTNNIHAVVFKTNPDQIILSLKRPSAGITKGVVSNVEEATRSLDKVLDEISSALNTNILRGVVCIGGNRLETRKSKGIAIISNSNNEINGEDILRAQQSSQSFSLPANRNLVHIVPQKFLVDGTEVMDSPVGMTGMRLEVESLIIDAFMPDVRNMDNVLKGVGFRQEALVANTLAGSYGSLTRQEKELGVIAIDLGASTTSFSIFEEGSLIYTKVLPIGGNYISNDICLWLQISHDDGENIKLNVGDAMSLKVDKKEMVNLGSFVSGEDKNFSRKELAEVIEARVEQIFDFINEELKLIGKYGKLPGGVVLYGGGANLPHILELAKEKLKLPARIAHAQFDGLVETDPSFVNSVGAVKWYLDDEHNNSQAMSSGGFGNMIRKIFKNFNP